MFKPTFSSKTVSIVGFVLAACIVILGFALLPANNYSFSQFSLPILTILSAPASVTTDSIKPDTSPFTSETILDAL